MPSRPAVALIVVFWLVVTGYVAYRDLWPVLFASGPPPVAIDLADEAAQNVPTRWTITLNGQKAGRLVTQIRYIDADDTFRFTHDYKQLRYAIGNTVVVVPELRSVERITRAGDLREQSAEGTMELYQGEIKLGDVTAKVVGTVAEGQLTAVCDLKLTFAGGTPLTFNRTLPPVPVPSGQPLNPLQPLNRIADLHPGRRWAIARNNPLDDALGALGKEFGVNPPPASNEPLIGEVLAQPRDLDWRGKLVSCWVIEYREAEPVARTWVRVSDSKVLKQEAFKKGEQLSIERDE